MINDVSFSKDFKNPVKLLQLLRTKPEEYWIKRGEKNVLRLFGQMARRVPAYRDFLKKNKIGYKKVKTIDDFKKIPTIDKDNYLRKYPLEKMCWDGEFKNDRWVISATSGSTGEPFYFPRQDFQDQQYAITAELYLLSNFEIDKKSTLYIDGFAMGAWIGGLFTYEAIKRLAERGDYQLSIITPGIFKEEIIKAVRNLGNKFEQIIIGGYPPLIKDTIDDGIRQGLDWSKYHLGFIFSAEGFNEGFRDYIAQKTGLTNIYKDTLNHYGTVDLGTMAHETSICIFIRRYLQKNNLIEHVFLEKNRLPTLVQFIPEQFYFEEKDFGLICSAYSGLPLVRYDLKDFGGVISLRKMTELFDEEGISLFEELDRVKIGKTVWNLPFVYVYERKDFIVKLYGANIYPETIKKTLDHQSLADYLTGKFTMLVKLDVNHNQYLEINVEKKPGVNHDKELEKKVQNLAVQFLIDDNSEYRSNHKESPERQIPKIVFWEYEHPLYFKPGIKQKWVKKDS